MRRDEDGSKAAGAFGLVCQASLYFIIFIPVLVYPGASFLVGSLICIYIRPCVCAPVCACQGIDRWAGASCLLRDLWTVQAWFSARAQSEAHHTSAVALTSITAGRHTFPSCYCVFLCKSLQLISSVSLLFSVLPIYICSVLWLFLLIDYLPPGHRFEPWLYFCSSFNPPCTVLLVHMPSICG